MRFIDNCNIKSSFLTRSKLHFNKSGTAVLTKNFAKIANSDWLYRNIDEQVNNLTKDSPFIASNVAHLASNVSHLASNVSHLASNVSHLASNVSHLDNLRSKNPKKIIFSVININSIHNTFQNLCNIVGNNVDVLSISETKLDSSFPNAQFLLPGFHEPLRLDINHRSGGLLVYIKTLVSKILTKL